MCLRRFLLVLNVIARKKIWSFIIRVIKPKVFFSTISLAVSHNIYIFATEMKVKVNRTIVEVFEGAEVRHALLTYLARRHKSVKLVDQMAVYDSWGHEIDQDAPVSQHREIKAILKP